MYFIIYKRGLITRLCVFEIGRYSIELQMLQLCNESSKNINKRSAISAAISRTDGKPFVWQSGQTNSCRPITGCGYIEPAIITY